MTVYGKRPALRLDPESYNQLRLQILRRDGWKCQLCGRLENLQIHHQHFRSRGGSVVFSGERGLWSYGLGAGYAHRNYARPAVAGVAAC